MHKIIGLFLILIILVTFPACQGHEAVTPESEPTAASGPSGQIPLISPTPSPSSEPEEESTYDIISNEVDSIEDSPDYATLAGILGSLHDIDKARSESEISEADATGLRDILAGKFDSWIEEAVAAIDVTRRESIKDFYNLQAAQGTVGYVEFVSYEAKQSAGEAMRTKFNAWVKNQVDVIDPVAQDALKDLFDLQIIQGTGKYNELSSLEITNYVDAQMRQKLNEWVRNRVDEIDPYGVDNLKYFFWLQTVQSTEIYDIYATYETRNYIEQHMEDEFNQWIQNRVIELDPYGADFMVELEKLLAVQQSDKYDKLITGQVHAWKEDTIIEEMDEYAGNLADGLEPAKYSFWNDLYYLAGLQESEVYKKLCTVDTREYVDTRMNNVLVQMAGTQPKIQGTYPKQWQVGVPLDQGILVAFDRAVQLPSLKTAVSIQPEIKVDIISVGNESKFFLIIPQKPLLQKTGYTVTIGTGVISLRGIHMLEAYELSFNTKNAELPPQVVSTTPENGDSYNLAGQPVTITFDQKMAADSVESAITVSPGFDYSTYWRDGGSTLTLQSYEPLAYNTEFTVNIGEGALSAEGVSLEPYQFGFTTAIMNYPKVLGNMPESGLSVPPDYPIQIIFDRSMDRESVESHISISKPGFNYNAIWSDNDMVLRMEPMATLPPDITYNVSLSAGSLSTFGFPVEDDYKFVFTTR